MPSRIEGDNDCVREFKVEHDPVQDGKQPDNYAHSEVRTYQNGKHNKKIKVPTTIKTEYRQQIADKTKIIKRPLT